MRNEGYSSTIAAIATPLGYSGIGIVRLSGPLCLQIASNIFHPSKAKHPLPSHRLCHGKILRPPDGHMVDEVLVAFMKAPNTYTREDCLEIQAHGGITVLQEILELVIDQGARMAEPGEFTLRAFLNGRIDLAQAEAVVDLIQAKSGASLELARKQLAGEHSKSIHGLKERLIEYLAGLEAAIDFPEEEVSEEDALLETESLDSLDTSLTTLIGSFSKGRLFKEGASLMIIGPPNAGKSSLLNAMVGFERVIVTEVPGTTRDIIEEWIEWKGMPIRAIDTAGLRDPKDPIEAEGHRMIQSRIENVDLLIWVIDGSCGELGLPKSAPAFAHERPAIVALNKMDLPQRLHPGDLPSFLRRHPILRISAKHGTGIEPLLDQVKELLVGSTPAEEVLLTNVRHQTLLSRCLEHVRMARQILHKTDYVELAVVELRDGLKCIQEILGESADDEVLSRIFSKFCIGK